MLNLNRRKFLQNSVKMAIFASAINFTDNLFGATKLSIPKSQTNSKMAIVYYSRTLNTHILTSYLAYILKADLFRLETIQNYPENYDEMVKTAAKERESHTLISLQNPPNLSKYTHIFIASPFWGMSLSTPIRTFISQTKLENKILIPLITNAGYSINGALREIENISKTALNSPLSFTFPYKEKDKRDLKSYNQSLLDDKNQQGIPLAFSNLQDNSKISTWLKSLKL